MRTAIGKFLACMLLATMVSAASGIAAYLLVKEVIVTAVLTAAGLVDEHVVVIRRPLEDRAGPQGRTHGSSR